MEFEQLPPNEPRFGLIVALFAIVILVIFVIAYFMLDWDGKRLVPHHFARHPTSQLVMPKDSVPVRAAEIQGSLHCA
jgi:hypothetical protein